MAIYENDGRITIDDEAARRDISNMKAARELLTEARKEMRQLLQEAESGKGLLMRSLCQNVENLIIQTENAMESIEDNEQYIDRTVRMYVARDQALKAQISSYSFGG